MFSWASQWLLRVLRVPPQPEPPAGAPESVRVFRAGKNYFYLRLSRWTLTQFGAVVGILFSLTFIHEVELGVAAARASQQNPVHEVRENPERSDEARVFRLLRHAAPPQAIEGTKHFMLRAPWWALPLVKLLEFLAIAAFIAQLPITLAAVRLDFEQRWYMVTDRSLRLRAGVFRLSESTMSFANLQQVEVKQGPVQRLLGLADVRVQSAGGGGGDSRDDHDDEDSLHTAVFQSVTNASEIRDLILDRLRRFRQASLGDPDDHHEPEVTATTPAAPTPPPSTDTLAAAQELLTEARSLRSALAANRRST